MPIKDMILNVALMHFLTRKTLILFNDHKTFFQEFFLIKMHLVVQIFIHIYIHNYICKNGNCLQARISI